MSRQAGGSVTIHGHFYQPPRENPWIEAIELEESAAPQHDWNERVVRDSYLPNSCARIMAGDGRVADIVNNYSLLSYDFGPTILSWLERNYPQVYRRILKGDQIALERLGHGAAIAGAYNHPILPLCHERDLDTQIIWGIEDFRHRFGRDPEAMWLPETAINTAVIKALSRHKMKFCILAPTQAEAVRPLGGLEWQDVSYGGLDTTQPYRCYASPPGGAQGASPAATKEFVDVFFYNGAVAHDISFGDVLSDARRLVELLAASYSPSPGRPQLLDAAVDGETFGHHKPLGEMGLAYALKVAAPKAGLTVTNYSAFLEGSPSRMEVRLKTGPHGEGTAWSCAHGLGRWQRDCGCTTGSRPGWNQGWRAPLRQALDMVRDRLAPLYEAQAARLLVDPWEARNGYIQVILDRSQEGIEGFCERFCLPGTGQPDRMRALKLLEMQRHCLLMYTSCGWFFADISGIETVQNLRYAARAMELAAEFGLSIEKDFLSILENARSNLPEMGNGGQVYERMVRPSMISPERVVNHFAIGSIFTDKVQELDQIFHYRVRVLDYDKRQRGSIVVAVGLVELTSGIIPEPRRYLFAMSFLGGYFFRTGVRISEADSAADVREHLFGLLEDRPGDIVQFIEHVFGAQCYSLRDVFREQKKHILNALVSKELQDYQVSFEHVFETTRDAMEEMSREGLRVPEEFQVAAEKVLSHRLAGQVSRIQTHPFHPNKIMESDIKVTIGEARLFGLKLHTAAPRRQIGQTLIESLGAVVSEPSLERVEEANSVLDFAASIDLGLDLTEPQNMFDEFLKERFPALAAQARKRQGEAMQLAQSLISLAANLNFSVEKYERLLGGGHGQT
jgi:alpha-amylase/alpha-mannosidase (GH57 family)